MGTIPASENEFPQVLFAEVAAPSTPASGLLVVYAKSDGKLYTKNDAGTEVELGAAIAGLAAHLADTGDAHDASAISVADSGNHFTATDVEAALAELFSAIGGGGGSVATDAIWDAAGDLAVGSGANTAAKLAIGATNGMALQRVSGAVAWALPPGFEFDFAETTSNTNITATSEATANAIVTGNAVSYDGSTMVEITFFIPYVQQAAGDTSVSLYLYDGSSSIGRIGLITNPTATGYSGNFRVPVSGRRRLTPSNASHTYSIRGATNTGTAVANGGAGGSTASMPAYMRITKV